MNNLLSATQPPGTVSQHPSLLLLGFMLTLNDLTQGKTRTIIEALHLLKVRTSDLRPACID